MNAKDMENALANWHRMLTIQPDADPADPVVQRNIASIEQSADKALSEFKRENMESLFLPSAPTTSQHMTEEFSRITAIAKAWGSAGTKYYQNDEILELLLYSLQWMYQHRYGENERLGNGWRSTRLFNWHDWKIGSPEHIIHTLIILGDRISASDAAKYLRLFDELVPEPTDYASNKVHFGKLIIGSGLLQRSEERIHTAIHGIEDTHIYVDGRKNNGQGFYSDGSYIFHTRHAMNGSYARIHFSCLVDICRIFKGTKFADPALEARLCEWAVNAFVPFLSKTVMARSVICRHPDAGRSSGIAALAALCELAVFANSEIAETLLRDVKRNLLANPEMGKVNRLHAFYARLSADAAALLRKVMEDDAFLAGDYNRNKVFHNEDRVVHHHKGVSYSLSMSSSRIYNYESINHENMDGWYLGDGMLTAYTDDFYAYADGWPQSDPYRRPGTTADVRERECISISQRNEYLSSQDFVGGVSDGICGAAAMRLESYHGDGEHISKRYFSPDGAYGGPPAKRKCTLLARKAWFFFDTIAVCLGSDISAQDDADVITVIDSRRTASPLILPHCGEFNLTDTDQPLPASTSVLYIDTFGGYYFPQPMKLMARRYAADVPFTEIIADHGVNPKNGTYAYALLPTYSEAQTAAFAEAPVFTILSNTRDVQAVRHKDGRAMYVFWSAGAQNGIEVSDPLMLLVSNGNLYVSDPTQKLACAAVRINGKEYTFDFTEKYGATLSVPL